MTQKQNIRNLLTLGLVLGSLGGWLLHLRIHPPAEDAMNFIPFVTGLVSIFIIPAMFLSKKSIAYAYVINGMLVIIGAITMGRVSLFKLPAHLTFATIIVGTLFSDFLILGTNYFCGKALFELHMLKTADAAARKGRFWRYPNMGWWYVHSATLTLAYLAGHLLWK